MKKVVKLASLMVLLASMVVGCGPKDPADSSLIEPTTGEPTGDSTPVPGPGDSTPVPGDSSPVPVEKTLESIEMDNYPSSDPVKSVEDVDLSSVTIKLIYSDGTSEVKPVTKDMIKWSEVVDGVATATVEYEGKTTTFVVNIEEEIVKTDLVYSFTIESGAVFQYDGSEGQEVPDIRVTVESPNAEYEWYFAKDEGATNLGKVVPTEAGVYTIEIHLTGSKYYNDVNDFRWFKIIHKEQPAVEFSFEAGQEFAYDGTGEKPNIGVVVPEGVKYTTYFEDENGNNVGTDIPTTPGRYSFIVETVENDQYVAYRTWRPLVIKAPDLLDPVITFGETVKFDYDGNPHTPTFSVSPEGLNYSIHYTKSEQFYSYDAPTEAGWYALVVEVEAGNGYNAAKAWKVFEIKAPKAEPTIEFTFDAGQEFAYDGTGEKPNIGVVVLEKDVKYTTYFEESEVNIGTEIPTKPGTYSLIIETVETDQYAYVRAYRWFRITAPGTLEPTITFGEEVAFTYDGQPHTPTFTVSPEGLNYSIEYTKNDIFYSYDAPTEVGWYALVVKVEAGNGYSATTKWVVFHIDEPVAANVNLKNISPR